MTGYQIQDFTSDGLVLRCAVLLEVLGKRFLVDFGVSNALEKARQELLPGELRDLIDERLERLLVEKDNGAGI